MGSRASREKYLARKEAEKLSEAQRVEEKRWENVCMGCGKFIIKYPCGYCHCQSKAEGEKFIVLTISHTETETKGEGK